ncbi:inactive ubiquitin carboxyl-terminal hydrolase 50 isoform X1 [Ornithorhynchus anatinus]|uniref:inactive ubiquitin carboxyl-terminal hydrolase 50 isoform X1 n=1 Tax=Ornithorhynchus anatinus TaxID=9258 RepID=UPI0010A8DFF1|nr:inactive ubiquitin carboxyl-terminal hydrolase 50 isoform X1 [Ornithorhynchus anatinus]
MASGPPPDDDFDVYRSLECSSYGDHPLERSAGSGARAQGVTGLRNLGNTCYMNAVLQCLASIAPLVEYFLSGKYVTALHRDRGEVATALAYLLTDMWLGDADCVAPEVFRLAVGDRHPAFGKKSQQDAQEFLIFVLNALHEALKKPRRRKPSEKAASRRGGKAAAGESSIVSQLFEGQLSYDVVCLKCDSCSYKGETFTVLSLPIPSHYQCSLQAVMDFGLQEITWLLNMKECLERFFQQDTLRWNNQIYCSYCDAKQDAAVRATVVKAPNVVIFHLKRFECYGKMKRKLRTNIRYPLANLDLSPYIYPPCRKHPKYNLWAVVNHFGDLDGGHYTALCKNTVTQSWFSFDDTRVCEVPEAAVQTAAAYLLCYSCQPFSVPSHGC